MMPPFPHVVTRDQVRAALDALGLPPHLREVHISYQDGVTATMHARDRTGRVMVIGGGPATVTVHVPYDGEEVTAG